MAKFTFFTVFLSLFNSISHFIGKGWLILKNPFNSKSRFKIFTDLSKDEVIILFSFKSIN